MKSTYKNVTPVVVKTADFGAKPIVKEFDFGGTNIVLTTPLAPGSMTTAQFAVALRDAFNLELQKYANSDSPGNVNTVTVSVNVVGLDTQFVFSDVVLFNKQPVTTSPTLRPAPSGPIAVIYDSSTPTDAAFFNLIETLPVSNANATEYGSQPTYTSSVMRRDNH